MRSETVAREGPASYHPGIALLKRNEHVTIIGEREGWSEVRLGDGRSGYVRSSELAPLPVEVEAHPADASATPAAAVDPQVTRGELERLSAQQGALLAEMQSEIGRLRAIADTLAAVRPASESTSDGEPDGAPWQRADVLAAGSGALLIGFTLGALSQRRRSRRERTLRF